MIRVSPNPIQRNKSRGILTWYARIFDTETKSVRYESLGTTKKTEARTLLLDKIQNKEFEERKPTDITLENALALYIEHERNKGVKKNSIVIFENALACLKPLFCKRVCDIDRKSVIDTFNENCSELAASTYNMKKVVCKGAFKFFVKDLELFSQNYFDYIPSRKKDKKERHFWTLEQIDEILEAAQNPMRRLLWSFMAFAGLRISEALHIVPKDIYDGYIHVVGKGDKFALIPVSSRMSDELCRVGWEWDFSDFSSRTENYYIHKIVPTLDFESKGKNSPHRFRHSFASNLVISDVNLKVVQTLMRHADIQTTLNIYSHLVDAKLGSEMEKMFK